MKDEILDYLAQNKDYYVDFLELDIKHMEDSLKSNKIFRDDILKGFEEFAKRRISSDIANKFNIPIDEAYSIIEDANMRSYLK